ncbi:MAG: maleylacetoacetate isomerase [Rhodoferax sp.]|uniref:maleylacetoacetate isomerase n=1 Tax=Rhodoferax sp. TaxID=50421 RepID=UPI00326479E9
MALHTYFRSSAAYRVRIALGLKGLDAQMLPVHLLKNGGEHHSAAYLAVNPAGLVPALVDDGQAITQSLAIIEYLEERWPQPALLGSNPLERAHIRALALDIACEIHPLNNLRVLNYLKDEMGLDEEQKMRWYRHWTDIGLATVEARLVQTAGQFCVGDSPSMADCCLVPQVFNAQRFACNLDHVPTVVAVHARCVALPAFQQAAPEQQLDAE